MIKYTSYIEGMHKSAYEEISMEVKLIAHTDVGELVCGVASKNCVSESIPELCDENADDLLRSMKGAEKAGHESILEHMTFTFAISGVSRVTEVQLVRHRIGASYSIRSGRYVKQDEPEFIIPPSVKKAEYSELMNGGGWSPNGCLEESLKEYRSILKECAERMRKLGVPEEDIRYLYPQGTSTNIICTFNARELKHVLAVRLCNRAQWEIREMANKMWELVKDVAPNVFNDIGPSCVQYGYCPEGNKGCGKCPTMKELLNSYEESHGKD